MFRRILGNKKKKHFDINKYDIGESELNYWSTVSVETDEFLVIVRVRIEKPRLPDIAEYNKCVCIAWEYTPDIKQLPEDDVNEAHVEFESSLDELTMYNNLSFLMGVSNGRGLKDWAFYVKDCDEFMEILNKALENRPLYPIKVQFIDDPNWEIWKEKLEIYEKSQEQG
jgi:hypothetical protein